MKHFLISLMLVSIFSPSDSYALGAKRPKVIPTPPISTGDESPSIEASLNSPWNKSHSSIVIDAYEGNSIDWNKMATDSKVVGVIHRSSTGLKIDAQYEARKKIALERGYLWGAYHLGRPGNTIAQAKLFLSLIKNEPKTLMILDLEDTSSGSFMSLNEAAIFMDYIYENTGRTPVVYANQTTTVLLNQKVKNNPRFQQSKLWYARFKATVTDFPTGIWENYFLWQFSSEINCSKTGACLYNVPGTKSDMDVNVFYGSARELADKWNND
jgi:GH25 family lysozyme M1 (1,4-beta-N-acetylmuramidase)